MRYVLDTNTVIAALNGVPSVLSRLTAVPAGDVALPVVVLGELLYGAYRSRRKDANLAKLAELRKGIGVLPVTERIAERYAEVRADLQSRGIAKSDFDLLIACTGLDTQTVVVTDDHALLDGSIAGLTAENWLA